MPEQNSFEPTVIPVWLATERVRFDRVTVAATPGQNTRGSREDAKPRRE